MAKTKVLLGRKCAGGQAQVVYEDGGLVLKVPGREDERLCSYREGAHKVFTFAGVWPDYATKERR